MGRKLHSTSDDTCLAILEEEGFTPFADLTRNAASSLQISLLAAVGSCLLAMMLV